MSLADFVNGSFEFLGGLFLWTNVVRLHKDKELKGVNILPVVFFSLWGYWNLYYYPSLNQWFSFIGGLNVVIPNSIWVAQSLYYRRKNG